jgi:hypothetical protein
MYRYRCPHCDALMEAPESLADKKGWINQRCDVCLKPTEMHVVNCISDKPMTDDWGRTLYRLVGWVALVVAVIGGMASLSERNAGGGLAIISLAVVAMGFLVCGEIRAARRVQK